MFEANRVVGSRFGAALMLLSLLIVVAVTAGSVRPVLAGEGTFKFSSATYSTSEGDAVILTITRPSGDTDAVFLNIYTTTGTATGADFDEKGNDGEVAVSFNEGVTERMYSIQTFQDGDDEGDHKFTVTIDNSQGGEVTDPSTTEVTIIDDDGPPVFTAGDVTVLESEDAVVTITRSGNTTGEESVTFYTDDGTANEPGDYTAVGDTVVTFPDGVVTKTVNVNVIDDNDDELGDETVLLKLKDPTAGTKVDGTLTIKDDENGVIEFQSATYTIGESDVTATVTLKRTGGTDGEVTVNCDTKAGGSADSPEDFDAFVNQAVTFSDGESSETCDIVIKEDGDIEGDETINLEIDTPTGGAHIGDQNTAVLTIEDDEVVSTVEFQSITYNVTEGNNPTVTITVIRTGDTTGTASVKYDTGDNTALEPGDYTEQIGGTVSFVANETSKTFPVAITNDVAVETAEDFTVTLHTPTNAGLGTKTVTTVTITDNDGLAPVVTSLAPNSGLTAGGQVVVITGMNFTGTTSVVFGIVVAPSFTVDDDNTISVTTPAHALGPVGVIVTNANGAGNANVAFTFTEGLPAILSVTPASGPISGGTPVVIKGIRFTGTESVTFGGTIAAFTFVNDTTLNAMSPAHTPGTFDVVVTTAGGSNPNTGSDDFTYTTQSTFAYTLHFRWSLIVWAGANNADAMDALKGIETPNNPLTNNVFAQVTAIFTWNNALQAWLGYFPEADEQNIPGANDFTELKKGTAYWIAVSVLVTWTIIEG